MPFRGGFARFSGIASEISANGKKVEISTCQPGRTPYNAPPSTRHNGLRHAVLSGSAKSESPEKNFLKRG
ncbi:hypothetical protein C2E15_16545 [Mixta gaviniae]|uniref:Uncharacterized protein n=1 Tax=Mixta gaviniae TaxID=665914 RepID=A0A2L0IIX4_9GAMM|nr:hypothetical protein C2E15_16545 [Mixta gaviniae]